MKTNIFLLSAALLLTVSVPVAVQSQVPGMLSDWENYNMQSYVNRISSDGETVWLATGGGLVKYDKRTGGAVRLSHANSQVACNDVRGVFCHDGTVWAGYAFNGFDAIHDGMTFEHFDAENSPIFINQDNVGFAADDDGNIWIGGLLYVYRRSPDGNRWRAVSFPQAAYSSFLVYSSLAFDSEGTLWIGSQGAARHYMARITADGTAEEMPWDVGEVTSLAIDSKDGVWASTKKGLCHYDGKEVEIISTANSPLPADMTYGICVDSEDNVWFGAGNKLCKYDRTSFSFYDTPTGGFVTSLLAEEGTIWVGTSDDGLYRFDADGLFRHVWSEDFPMTINLTTAGAAADGKGNVYLNTGDSMLHYAPDGQWSKMFYSPKPDGRSVKVFTEAGGVLWAAFTMSDSCLARVCGKDTTYFTTVNSPLKKGAVNSLAACNDGRLWVGASDGLFLYDGKTWVRYDHTNTPMESDYVGAIAIDHEGKLWYASEGLCSFDGKVWRKYDTSNSPITTKRLRGLTVDSRNRIWFACGDDSDNAPVGTMSGDGVYCFDGTEWKHWNRENSPLPSNSVLDIAEDSNGRFWMATFGGVGLTCFDGKDGWHFYTVDNSGIQSNDVISLAIDTRRDMLWMSHFFTSGFSSARLNTGTAGTETPWMDWGKDSKTYDLQGRSLPPLTSHPSPLKKSIYIENGRKRVVKH